jgi:hypothetical protein
MKEVKEYEKDIAAIRNTMDRSLKVVSLSGFSGILAGIYALIGAAMCYLYVGIPVNAKTVANVNLTDDQLASTIGIGLTVLFFAILTAYLLTRRKAKKMEVNVWNTAGKRLLSQFSIPIATGGLFALLLLLTDHPILVAPATLIFYGLALIQASANTVDEIRYLGFLQIMVGLICTGFPAYGLILWAFGFGVLHIVYGAIMYSKYDL